MPLVISTLQEVVEREGGARLCQPCETAKNEGKASLKRMKCTATEEASATSTAALCTNGPEWAISWQSGQFEGFSLMGYLSPGIAAWDGAATGSTAATCLAAVTMDIV